MTFKNRLKKLQSFLKEKEADGAAICGKNDLFYLTGLHFSEGTLLVSQKDACLFVDPRYSQIAKERSPISSSPLSDVALRSWMEEKALRKILFDSQQFSFARYERLKDLVESDPPGLIQLLPIPNLLLEIRAVKDEEEISRLRDAADLGSRGFDHIVTLLREGITEEELARELEVFWLHNGGKGLAFDPIIAFGACTAMPHYRSGAQRLQNGMPVLMDIGVNFQEYCSDMTRVVFFGDVDPEIKTIYQVVLEAQEAALELCKPGTPVSDLDQAARKVIDGAGYGDCFTHSLGHGIGLDVHELPFMKKSSDHSGPILKAGMAITIEPGIYLPDKGGVRIEDTVVITKAGYEDLTKRPKDISSALALS